MYTSYHTWIRHVTHEYVMSYTWMRHATHMNEAWHMDKSCGTHTSRHTCGRIMPHLQMSHVALMDESCHTCEWVMSHLRMRHVALMNESCCTDEWVMSHICISRAPQLNVSFHTSRNVKTKYWPNTSSLAHDCILSRAWISHVTSTETFVATPCINFMIRILTPFVKCVRVRVQSWGVGV